MQDHFQGGLWIRASLFRKTIAKALISGRFSAAQLPDLIPEIMILFFFL